MTSLRRQILSIALPAIVSNITTPLLAMIDVAIVGHIGSASYIAAIALGSTMFNMLYWLFGFLRMGSSGTTAQAFGAGDRVSADTLFYRSLTLGLLAGIILLAFSHPLSRLLLTFLDADPSTLPLARKYFLLAICGAPATLATFALSGWFLGMQNSRWPMWMAIVTNVVNIAASLLFVFGLGWDLKGVAIGSAIAQWTGFLFGLTIALRRFRPARPSLSRLLKVSELRRFFAINADIFLRTLCLVAVTLWFTRSGASQGAVILAANALLLQLFMFFSYFMDGFAFAGEALSGRFAGSGDRLSLKQLIGALTRIGICLAIAFSAIYAIFGHEILSLLTNDASVIHTAGEYRWWAVAVPIAGTLAFVWDGILIGLTYTRLMLAAMALAAVVFFILGHLPLGLPANHQLWLSFVVYLAVRGIVEILSYKKIGHAHSATDLS